MFFRPEIIETIHFPDVYGIICWKNGLLDFERTKLMYLSDCDIFVFLSVNHFFFIK